MTDSSRHASKSWPKGRTVTDFWAEQGIRLCTEKAELDGHYEELKAKNEQLTKELAEKDKVLKQVSEELENSKRVRRSLVAEVHELMELVEPHED